MKYKIYKIDPLPPRYLPGSATGKSEWSYRP